jgi:hypothetical protein
MDETCSSEFQKAWCRRYEQEAITHGLAGRAAAVDPAGLGLDVVLLALAEVAEQPPCAAAALAHYTFFLGTSHKEPCMETPSAYYCA